MIDYDGGKNTDAALRAGRPPGKCGCLSHDRWFGARRLICAIGEVPHNNVFHHHYGGPSDMPKSPRAPSESRLGGKLVQVGDKSRAKKKPAREKRGMVRAHDQGRWRTLPGTETGFKADGPTPDCLRSVIAARCRGGVMEPVRCCRGDAARS